VRAKLVVAVLAAMFVFYAVTIGWRGVLLVRDGRLVPVVLGIGVLLLPLVAGWAVWREVQFGLATERLARRLDAEGGLPVDDLPRRPSGRIDRSAADSAFADYRAEVEEHPDDWRSWYRLATAYDAAGDRRRARAAARTAIARSGSGPAGG
jgi:cytochrome c-type biogenesis protein CcmH/NrfG